MLYINEDSKSRREDGKKMRQLSNIYMEVKGERD